MPAVAVKKKSAGLLSSQQQHPGKKTMSAAASLEDAEDEKVFLERSVEFSEEGDQLMQKRQYVKALQFYEQAKKLMPKGHELSSSVDANRAECYLLMNRHADAVSAASDALKMNAENAQALVTRAKAYVSTQNKTRA